MLLPDRRTGSDAPLCRRTPRGTGNTQANMQV